MADASNVQFGTKPRDPADAIGALTKKPDTSESKLDVAYNAWKTKPSKDAFKSVMTAVNPVINSAVTSYAPMSSPAVRSKAKVIAKNAIETYDPTKGAKLRTHLMNQMQQLRREQGSYSSVHMPERVRFDLTKLNEASNRFVYEHGMEPSEDELADYTGLSRKRISHIRKYARPSVMTSAFEAESEDDAKSDPAVYEAASLWEDFVYEGLGRKDQRIYDLKTGKGASQRPLSVNEIAKKMGMSASAVSQRLAKIATEIQNGPEE